jgi:predicted small metal-binding protein
MRRVFAAMLAAVLSLCFCAPTYAQETAKKETKKEEKHTLKSVSCAPTCGFMVRSHDEKELTAIVMEHAKKAHKKEMTEKDVMGMMKTEEMPMETKEETKMEKKRE